VHHYRSDGEIYLLAVCPLTPCSYPERYPRVQISFYMPKQQPGFSRLRTIISCLLYSPPIDPPPLQIRTM
jgi:hypothetical protein